MNRERRQVGLRRAVGDQEPQTDDHPRETADDATQDAQVSATAESRRVHQFPITNAAEAAQRELARQWTLAAIVAVLGIACLISLFIDTAASMVQTWQASSSFGHGFLIVPISLFLVWRMRDRLSQIAPKASVWGLAVMPVAAAAWLLGDTAGALVIQQLALILMLQAMVLAVLGWPATRIMAFPLFYLYFAVPIGTFAIEPLQDFTAHFTVRLLQQIGIPVYLDGIFIHIPSGSFEVAEACAGLRFLISSIALGVIFANLFYNDLWRRLLFVGLSIVVPIIANGFRAFGIVMLAHLSDHRLAVEADHVTYGLIFLSLVFFCLIALGVTFRERNPAPAATIRRLTEAAPARIGILLLVSVAALAIAGMAPAYATFVKHRSIANSTAPVVTPHVRSAWQRLSTEPSDWRPDFPMVDADSLHTYYDGQRQVDVYVGYYAYQRQGAEVVHSGHSFADRDTWQRAGGGHTDVTVDGQVMPVKYQRLLSRSGARVVWYWYWVDGRFTASPYVAKLLEIRAKLLGGEQAAAIVAVSTSYEEQPGEATSVLRDFLAVTGPFGRTLAYWAS